MLCRYFLAPCSGLLLRAVLRTGLLLCLALMGAGVAAANPRAVAMPVAERQVQHYVVDASGAWRVTIDDPAGTRTENGAPLLPGHFERLIAAPVPPVRELVVIVDMPAALALHADAVGFVPVPAASPPERRRYQWRLVSGGAARRAVDSVSTVDAGPRLALSTLADYPALAAAWRQARSGGVRTPGLAPLARQLTSSLPDAHARALALSGWVGRYAGDKDAAERALLLQAMLTAAGIDSTPALVNGGNAYRLPDVPLLAVLDHVVTHVPALGLYLDPAADAATPGELPPGLLGKPALLVRTGTFAMTPLLQGRKLQTRATVDLHASARDGVVLARPDASVSQAIAAMLRERERRQDYVCPALDVEDETAFRLPQGARVLGLPKPLRLVHGGLFYEASYARTGTQDGASLLVRRRLTFRHGLPTCTPADYRALRPALERIRRDLRSQVVVAGG